MPSYVISMSEPSEKNDPLNTCLSINQEYLTCNKQDLLVRWGLSSLTECVFAEVMAVIFATRELSSFIK